MSAGGGWVSLRYWFSHTSPVGLSELYSLYLNFLILRDITIDRNFKSLLSMYMKIFAVFQLYQRT